MGSGASQCVEGSPGALAHRVTRAVGWHRVSTSVEATGGVVGARSRRSWCLALCCAWSGFVRECGELEQACGDTSRA
jgi:hypothetical protein